jgi:quinol monooxygenase YgiN
MTSIKPRDSIGSNTRNRRRLGRNGRDYEQWGYLIIWEFQVRSGMEYRFETRYGPKGLWARLFAQDESYMGTDLIHHLSKERTYVTLDFWTSQAAYDAFRKQHRSKYKAIDQKCEELTESEREIGKFVRLPGKDK